MAMAIASQHIHRILEPNPAAARGRSRGSIRVVRCSASNVKVHNVEMEHGGRRYRLEVSEEETILERALEAGIEAPHDCKLGVCMTCPARLESGSVDQSEGMLSDDVKDRGYALLCVAYPRSDCRVRTIPEDELLSLQLVTSAD